MCLQWLLQIFVIYRRVQAALVLFPQWSFQMFPMSIKWSKISISEIFRHCTRAQPVPQQSWGHVNQLQYPLSRETYLSKKSSLRRILKLSSKQERLRAKQTSRHFSRRNRLYRRNLLSSRSQAIQRNKSLARVSQLLERKILKISHHTRTDNLPSNHPERLILKSSRLGS